MGSDRRTHFRLGIRGGLSTCVALAAAAALAQGASAAGFTAYVTNMGGGTVVPIATSTNTAGAPITGVQSPAGIAVTPDGRTAWVTDNNGLSVESINTATNTTGSSILTANPFMIAIAPDGDRALVTNENETSANAVTPLDLSAGTAGTPIPVAGATDVAVSPNDTTAYVTTGGAVTPVTLATDTAGTPIPVPSGAQYIAISPDGRTAYVTGNDAVTPITLTTGAVGAPIAVPNGAFRIAIAPNGRTAYVTNGDATGGVQGYVTPVSLTTNTAGASIPVNCCAFGIAITPDGQDAYVADTFANVVTPISLSSGAAGTPIATGLEPYDVAVAHQPLIGNPSVEARTDGVPAGTAEAFAETPRYSAGLTSLHLYVDASSAATRVRIGLYTSSHGRPTFLLGQTTITDVAPGWNYVQVPTRSLSAGQRVWVAVLSPHGDGALRIRDDAASAPGAQTSLSARLLSLPVFWLGRNVADGNLSAYGN